MNKRLRGVTTFASLPAPVWVAISSTAFGLLLGYLLKHQCIANAWADNFQYSHLCYNDIQPLFGVRGISRALMPYRDVQMEYPVLTGMFMDLAGRVLRGFSSLTDLSIDDRSYFVVSSVLLAPFAFAITLVLRPHVRAGRLLIWSIGTPLVLYAFHNWDLIAVLGGVIAMVAMELRANGKTGAAIAIGASAKLYPAFMLPTAILERWSRRDFSGARRILLSAAGVYLLINVPWMIISNGLPGYLDDPNWLQYQSEVALRRADTNGWLGVWLFHAERYPDFGTVWYWIAHHGRVLVPVDGWGPGKGWYQSSVTVLSLLMFGAGSLWLLWRGYAKTRKGEEFPALGVAMGTVALFLLVSKVHSPQYALWLVPFLVMLAVPWQLVLAYLVADLAVYVSGFYYFTVMTIPAPAWMGIFEVSVLFRAAALAAVVAVSVSSGRLKPRVPSLSEVSSQ